MSCKKGLNWTEEETRTFLELCTEKQIILLMDGKKYKHVDIFHSLVEDMEKKGFCKTAQQMKLKLKNLKLAYLKCKRENSVSGAAKKTCPFYEQLDILYSTRPNVQVLHDASGIDTANIQTCEYIEDSTTNENEVPEDSNSSQNKVPEDSNSSFSNEPPRKKKCGLNKVSGRKSYKNILDNYTENMLESQKQLLTDMVIKQNDMQKEIIKVEMENQRLWEKEMIEKDQAFQREQMQYFFQAMQTMGSQAPQASQSNYGIPQNFFMPHNRISTSYKLPQNIKIIPLKQNNIIEANQINSSTSTSTATSCTILTEKNDNNSKV